MIDENDYEEAKNKVFAALGNDRFKWRTIAGVSQETNVPAQYVVQVIAKNRDSVIRAPVLSKTGDALFTTRDHFLRTATVGEKIRGAFKNRIY